MNVTERYFISWDLLIVYYDCENKIFDKNIFFSNLFLNANAEGTSLV